MEAFLEWLSSNTLIKYPFKENVTLTSTGGYVLPLDVILDLTISGVSATDKVYMSSMTIGLELVTLRFSSVDLATEIASIAIPRTSEVVRQIQGSGDNPEDEYTVRVIPGEGWTSLVPIFTHVFTVSATELEPSAVIPELDKVLSVDSANSPYLTTPGRLTGIVYLADGCNMEVVLDESSNTVTWNAAPGLGVGPCYACDEEEEVPRTIRTINGVQADDRHVFKVQGSECIEVRMYPDINMIAFHDHCRPCCDCSRLEGLEDRLEVIEGMVP